VQVPRRVWIAALLLSLLAALCAASLARRRRLSTTAAAAWSLATLALGLPMLIAFWLTGKRRP
jgi:ABC-type amino acid transport system permease subunit